MIGQLLDSGESRVVAATEHFIDRVHQSKHQPGNEERIRHVESMVFGYRIFESNWIRELRSSMELVYRKVRPLASDEDVTALLDDFDVVIAVSRESASVCRRRTVPRC